MDKLNSLIMDNIYLFICIIIVLLILATILFIMVSNRRKRLQIKKDFVIAEKIEEEMENSPKNNELESIIQKMKEDIEVKPEDVVKKFEEEQEEKAIISYQELVDNVKSGKIEIEEENSDINFVEALVTDSEPIVEAVEEESSVTPEMVKEAILTIERDKKEEIKPFKTSEFISPIYGRMESNVEYPKVKKTENIMDIMNTKDYNELTEEIKRQEEFLNQLIEFRNNL